MKNLYPSFVVPTPRNNETLCFVFFSPHLSKGTPSSAVGDSTLYKKIGVYAVWKNKKNRPGQTKSVFLIQILRVGIYACFLLVFAHSFVPNNAVYESEQRIVFTDTYVRAGMNLRASLANENVPCENRLTVASFYAKSFSLAVSTVVGRTGTFLMSE